MDQPQQRHATGRPMQARAQPSTRSTTERQPDLLQSHAERHGPASIARGQTGCLFGERLLWTVAIPTQEATNPQMDHQRVTDGFVQQTACVAAVDTPGAASALRAHRCRRCATNLNVDASIELEHAIDAKPSQMRKETNQTQTSISGALLRLGRLRRRGLPEISRPASRFMCQSQFYSFIPALTPLRALLR